jgi:hypothetical protein
MAGAPIGNKNSTLEKRLYANAIRRYAVQNPKKLEQIVEGIFSMASSGDLQAAKEIGDRIDGKAMQSIDATVRGSLTSVLSGLGRDSGSTEDDPSVA